MSLYIPNALGLIPADVAWDGNFSIEKAVAHPVLLHVPRRVETLDLANAGFAAPFLFPPPIVLAAFYAKKWVFSAEITAAGLTYSVSNEEVDAIQNTWRGVFKNGQSVSWDDSIFGGEDDLNYIDFSWSFGSIYQVTHSWADDEWWPGLRVAIGARDFSLEGAPFGDAFAGNDSDSVGDAVEVSLTVCGETVTLYRSLFDDDLPLSGTITIEPSEWIDVV